MTVYVVRHALAVPRKRWTGDDDDRPLTTRGGAQASVLTAWSKSVGLDSILSSPARRCVATVQGIASCSRPRRGHHVPISAWAILGVPSISSPTC